MYKVNLCKIYIKSICTNCCLFTRFKKVCDITGRPIDRGHRGTCTPEGGAHFLRQKGRKWKKINEGNEKGKKEGGEKIGEFLFLSCLVKWKGLYIFFVFWETYPFPFFY